MTVQVLLQLAVIIVMGTVTAHSTLFTCQYVNCPRFVPRVQNTNYDERVYASENWAATDADPNNLESSRLAMFQRLLSYFGGANVEGHKLNVTLPFLTKVVRRWNSNTTTQMSMYMYIPYNSQLSPPTPTDTLVRVQKTPVRHLYSRYLPGWTTRDGVDRVRGELRQSIGNVLLYDDTYFYLATYSPPFQMYDRYNEVWLVKRDANQAV